MRQSTLKLTEPQEVTLKDYLKRRLQELERDNRDRIKADRESDKIYRLQREERAKSGTVFEQSNFSIPLTSYVIDHFAARTEDELLGRNPPVRFQPQGPADDDVARGIDRLATYKLFDQGTTQADLQNAIHPIFCHRALLLKAVYAEKFNEWEEYDLELLHDRETGQPISILNHGFIIKGRDTFTPVTDIASQQEVQQLDADPTFQYDPAKHVFAKSAAPVRFSQQLFAAPKSRQVDSDRFRAPSNARSLDEADIIAEYYDKPVAWAMERFAERPWLTSQKYLAMLNGETAEKKTEGRRAEQSAENLQFDRDAKNLGVVEIWLKRDVLGWDKPQNLVIWYDRKRDVLISYDFAVKVTPQGAQPYTAVPVWQQDDVWWGYSMREMLQPIQDYIDLQFNRHSHRNAINTNPIVGEHADAIEGNMPFASLKPFEVVQLKDGKTMRDWLETFVFPNADHETQDLIDKAIYWANFWLGISNIARGDYSDVPQNTTLGGQEATLKEAGKLSRRFSRRVIVGLEDHLTKLVRLLVETMDEEETYAFLEGDTAQMGVIQAAKVRDLLIDARLVWNDGQDSRTIQTSQETLAIIEKYANYMMTAPWIIPMIRPVLKQALFALGHDNVDTLLPIPPGIPPMPIMPPAPVGGVTTDAGATASAPPGTVPFPSPQQPAAAPAPVGKVANA